MPDAFEEQAVLVAAEQAAAEGDTIAAEGHLRTLLELQTARLGPDHAEVASTLHNLAVVCERAGRLSDAEGLYRRAFTVASAALPPQDSLVVRCREDLNAFLEARLMPLRPSPAPAAAAAPSPLARQAPASGVRKPSPSAASRTPARPASRVRQVQPPSERPSARHWIAASAIVAVLVALIAVFVMRDRESAGPEPVAAAPAAAPAARRTPAKKTAPVATPAAPTPAASGAQPDTPPAAPVAPAAEPPTAPAPAAPPVASAPSPATDPVPPAPAEAVIDPEGVTVTDARLCRDLSTAGAWTCVPVDQPIAPGRLYYLTRLDVPSTMQVVHRWFYGDAVVQSVSLRVQPAGRPGYRTYSRQTIDPARAGAWRVELRSADGRVLAEERFTVQ